MFGLNIIIIEISFKLECFDQSPFLPLPNSLKLRNPNKMPTLLAQNCSNHSRKHNVNYDRHFDRPNFNAEYLMDLSNNNKIVLHGERGLGNC